MGKGWESYDWESFPENKSGHDALVRHLKEIVESKYRLELVEFDEEEAQIASWHGRKRRYIVAHKPDLIITDMPCYGDKREDRVFIEYVNTLGRSRNYISRQNYIRDLRGMLALSATVKVSRGYVVAVRDSVFKLIWPTELKEDSPVEVMSLRSLFFTLDRIVEKEDPLTRIRGWDYLVGRKPFSVNPS